MRRGRGWILLFAVILGGFWVATDYPTGPDQVALAQPPLTPMIPDGAPQPYASPAGSPSPSSSPEAAAAPAPPTATPTPVADYCVGDEQLTYVPEEPRIGAELLIAASSSRPHPYPRLAGTERTTQQGQMRPGQLGYVWEWTIQPSYPGHQEYTFYVDSTIPCTTIAIDVGTALATSTPKPTKTPTPFGFNANDNNSNDNQAPTSTPTFPPAVQGPTPTPINTPVPSVDRVTGPYLGVWTSGDASQTGQLDDLRSSWTRVVVTWASVETSSGVYNWSSVDSQVAAASGGGKRQVLAIVRNNPSWAAASRCRLTTDAERTNLAKFMTALVTRYKDQVKYWQLYNEMDNTSEAFDRQNDLGGCFGTASGTTPTSQGREDYARTLETVGAAIHAADSNAKVLTGGLVSGNHLSSSCPTCLFDADFARGVMSSLKSHGTLDRVDYLAVHFFSSQSVDYVAYGPDLLGRVARLRQDMRDAGLREDELKPIVVDEGSYTGMIGRSTSDSNDSFNRAQRDYVARALARAASADVVYLWFWLRDVNGSGLGGDNAYGLMAADGSQKPSYRVFRYFTSLVDRQERLIGRLTLSSPKFEGYEFNASDGRRFQIIWNAVDDVAESYTPGFQIGTVTDSVGNAVSTDGRTVSVGSEPRFIFYR